MNFNNPGIVVGFAAIIVSGQGEQLMKFSHGRVTCVSVGMRGGQIDHY